MEWDFKNEVHTLQEDAQHDNDAGEFARARLEMAPEISSPLYWASFFECNTMRDIGMGAGPIPFDKLEWYARCYLHLTPNETEAFIRVMRAMDQKFLELSAPKTN